MIQCQNRIGERCKLDGEVCKHLIYDGNCPRAVLNNINSVSFEDALNIILSKGTSCDKRKNIYRRGYNLVIEVCDFKWTDPVESFTYEVAEKFVQELEGKYKGSTIAGYVNAIYLSGNIKFRSYYKDKGMKMPLFERIPYHIKQSDKPKLKWEQKTAVKYEMERLRRMALNESICSRKRLQARNYFIALWFGWWYGTRPGDINKMKWENIVSINGVPHVKWTPHKTLKSTGIDICWPICGDAYNQIYRFIGQEDEFCIISEDKFIPLHQVLGETKNNNIHTYLWKSLNRFFRSIGIDGWAGFYSLRYMNAQETYKEKGEYAESLKLGHSVPMGMKAYYNKNDHSVL